MPVSVVRDGGGPLREGVRLRVQAVVCLRLRVQAVVCLRLHWDGMDACLYRRDAVIERAVRHLFSEALRRAAAGDRKVGRLFSEVLPKGADGRDGRCLRLRLVAVDAVGDHHHRVGVVRWDGVRGMGLQRLSLAALPQKALPRDGGDKDGLRQIHRLVAEDVAGDRDRRCAAVRWGAGDETKVRRLASDGAGILVWDANGDPRRLTAEDRFPHAEAVKERSQTDERAGRGDLRPLRAAR